MFIRKVLRLPGTNKEKMSETEPLLGTPAHVHSVNDEESSPSAVREGKPKVKDILSNQVVLNLLVYTMLAFYSIAYDQV